MNDTPEPDNRPAVWLLCLAATFATTQIMNANEYTLVPEKHGMALKTPDGRTVF